MKTWYKEIGDTKPSMVTPDEWDRPDDAGYVSVPNDPMATDPDFYNLVWVGDVVTAEPDAGYPARRDAAALAQAKALTLEAIVRREDEESWKPITFKGHTMKVTEAVSRTINRFKSMADSDPVPMLDGHWNDFYDVPVAMTIGELKELENAAYDRAMYNYGVRMYHSGVVNSLTTAEAVWGYDFSNGWQ